MNEKVEEKPTTLRAWESARVVWHWSSDAASTARANSIERSREHRAAQPLTAEIKNRIRTHLQQGGFLCCKEGKEFLKSLGLDECWVYFINTWAYEYMGCSTSSYGPGGDQHTKMLAKVEKLFEGGYDENNFDY